MLQSMGLQRVGHDLETEKQFMTPLLSLQFIEKESQVLVLPLLLPLNYLLETDLFSQNCCIILNIYITKVGYYCIGLFLHIYDFLYCSDIYLNI